MSRYERFGTRDRAFSVWHRHHMPDSCDMIDVDVFVQYRRVGGDVVPLMMLEVAQDVGQDYKCAKVVAKAGRLQGTPVYVVLYRKAERPSPFDVEVADIEVFRVKQLVPTPWDHWQLMTPQEFREFLWHERERLEFELSEGGAP